MAPKLDTFFSQVCAWKEKSFLLVLIVANSIQTGDLAFYNVLITRYPFNGSRPWFTFFQINIFRPSQSLKTELTEWIQGNK